MVRRGSVRLVPLRLGVAGKARRVEVGLGTVWPGRAGEVRRGRSRRGKERRGRLGMVRCGVSW